MTVSIPTGFAQATVKFTSSVFDSGNAVVVLGFDTGALSMHDVAEAVRQAVHDNLLPHIHENLTFDSVRAINDLDAGVATIPEDGGRSGDIAPPNCAVLVRKTASGRGRQNQGRNYWPGMLNDGDIVEGGQILGGHLSVLSGAFAAFTEDLATAEMSAVILHNSSDTDPSPVVGGAVENKVATQRRRLRR